MGPSGFLPGRRAGDGQVGDGQHVLQDPALGAVEALVEHIPAPEGDLA